MAAYIQRLSSFLPNAAVANDDMEAVLGQTGGRPSRLRKVILRANGIRTRHYVLDPQTGRPRYDNAQITAAAVRGLAGDGFDLSDLDLLACGTSSPDQLMPGHAVMVHGELGPMPCETVSLAGICCSGIAALKYAYLAVVSGQARHAVATGSEVASTFMRAGQFPRESAATAAELEQRPELAFDRDFLRWMLSDGAGAVLLGAEPGGHGLSLRVEWIELLSYAHEQPACMYAGAERGDDGRLRGWRDYGSAAEAAAAGAFTVKQDVRQLNDHVVQLTMVRPLTEVRRRHPLGPGDIRWFVPHYSSAYFRELTACGLELAGFPIPKERWFTNLARVGNVGSASPFLALEELVRTGGLRPGDQVLVFVPESGRFSAAFMLLTATG
jgi:3-oxoacyl-[acyl-carrier-protein] synthase-3